MLDACVSQRRDDNLYFYQRRQLRLALSDTLRLSHHPHSTPPLMCASCQAKDCCRTMMCH